MQDVNAIAAEIVRREGGLVNDPDDPGGLTKHGVTLAALQRIGRDLTGDGRVTGADIRALTPERAQEIFVEHYYLRPGLNRLPECIQASVFDMYVNSGANAVKILQPLLCDFGAVVDIDGALGPDTEAAAAEVAVQAPDHLADAYAVARRNYYYDLGDARPRLRKFARARDGGKGGWIRRAEAFMAARYRLSDIEHAQRTSAWA